MGVNAICELLLIWNLIAIFFIWASCNKEILRAFLFRIIRMFKNHFTPFSFLILYLVLKARMISFAFNVLFLWYKYRMLFT
jgi:hypothetical protein